MFGLFKALVLAPLTTVLGVNAPYARDFPTRTVEKENFSFDPATGMIHWEEENRKEPFALVVDGLVENSVKLSYSELRAMPMVTQVSDFHCVEGWTIQGVEWSGTRLKELVKLVTPLEGADYVLFHSLGETRSAPRGQRWYVEAFKLSDLLDPDQKILLAMDIDGQPLPNERGAPLRIIAPDRQAYKSIKFVHRVEFSNEMKEGWWTLANPIYDVDARVPERRLRRK